MRGREGTGPPVLTDPLTLSQPGPPAPARCSDLPRVVSNIIEKNQSKNGQTM